MENARPDLAKMGLEVVTFNVQDVKDAVDAMGHNHGVIEAIGVEQEELVKKRASIAKAAADANAAGMIQTNLRAKEVKESEADAEIARQKKMVDPAAQEPRSSSASWMPRSASRPTPSCTAVRRSRGPEV